MKTAETAKTAEFLFEKTIFAFLAISAVIVD